MLLSGIFPPVTTPFNSDGEVYYKKIEANVERYSRTPVAGIVIQGSTGEAILLSDQERRDVLKAALAAAAPNKVMIAGTGIESAHETLRLTEYAAQLGYDAAMVRTPHYYKKQMHPANLLAFYRTVADRSALPIIIYNFPQATGYDIPAELVIELAGHPNVVAIKESSGNLDKVKTMVELTRRCRKRKAEQGTGHRRLADQLGRIRRAQGGPARPVRQRRKTFLLRRNRHRKVKDASQRGGLPGHGRCRSPTRAISRIGRRGSDPRLCLPRSDGVLRNLRSAQRRRHRARP